MLTDQGFSVSNTLSGFHCDMLNFVSVLQNNGFSLTPIDNNINLITNDSGKLRALPALVPHVTHVLHALVPYTFSCSTCSCISSALCLTCSYA